MNQNGLSIPQPILVQLHQEASPSITALERELTTMAREALVVDNHSSIDLIQLASGLLVSGTPVVLMIWREPSAAWGKVLPLLHQLMSTAGTTRLMTNFKDSLLEKIAPLMADYHYIEDKAEALDLFRTWLQSS